MAAREPTPGAADTMAETCKTAAPAAVTIPA
jgi:hypothetical protein